LKSFVEASRNLRFMHEAGRRIRKREKDGDHPVRVRPSNRPS
jgi:hypothetical protein